jgi:hypothetical protein
MPRPATSRIRTIEPAPESVGMAGAAGARTPGVFVIVGEAVTVGVSDAVGVLDAVDVGVSLVVSVGDAVLVGETVLVDDAVGVADDSGVPVAVSVGVSVAEASVVIDGVGELVGVAVGPTMVSVLVLKLTVPARTLQPTLRSGPMQTTAGPITGSTVMVV